MIGMRLEKIVDIAMYLLIEKVLRREVSCIAKRYSDSNNEYMKNYDPKNRQKL